MSGPAEPTRESAAPAAAPRTAAASAAPGVASPSARVLALQRAVGNRAVGRVLARDGLPPVVVTAGDSPFLVGSPLGPSTTVKYQYKPVPDAVEAAIKTYVQNHRGGWNDRIVAGTISMPEVVAEIRENVPGALSIEAWQIPQIVRSVMGYVSPPDTRTKYSAAGLGSELAANIANAFPKPPKVKFSTSAGSLQLSVTGVEIETKVAGAKVTGTFNGSSVGLKTEVAGASFEAKLEKDVETDKWSKWSMELQVPLVGEAVDAVPPAPELKDTVMKAHTAIGTIASHLAGGGSPDDVVVKKALEDVKEAIEGVGKAVAKQPDKPSVTLGAKVEKDPSKGLTAGVTVTVTF